MVEEKKEMGDSIKENQDDAKTEEKSKEASEKKEGEMDITQLLPDSVEEIVKLNIFQMREWGYVFMGLIPHPKKKLIVKDMRQAKIAIDCASSMMEILLPHLEKKDEKDFKVMISDLKMNYISHSNNS